MVKGWWCAAFLAIALASSAACSDDDEFDAQDAERLCAAVAHLQAIEERPGELPADQPWEAPTDLEAIEAVIVALPNAMKTEAALRYYPYGGDIPEGVDTSGIRAGLAVERLDDFYEETCGA